MMKGEILPGLIVLAAYIGSLFLYLVVFLIDSIFENWRKNKK